MTIANMPSLQASTRENSWLPRGKSADLEVSSAKGPIVWDSSGPCQLR
jgi:hypothetical protein